MPFLLFVLAFTHMLAFMRGLRRHWRAVSLPSGALVGFGVLLATGELVRLTTQLSQFTCFPV